MSIYFYLSIMLFISVVLLLIKIKKLESEQEKKSSMISEYSKMCDGYFNGIMSTRKLLLDTQKRGRKLNHKMKAQELHIKKMSKDKNLYCSSTEFRRWSERTGHKI